MQFEDLEEATLLHINKLALQLLWEPFSVDSITAALAR